MTPKEEHALHAMNEAITKLTREGIKFKKSSIYHLKVGKFNFWPSTGKIGKDGESGIDATGLDAFIELARGTAAKRAGPSLHVVPKTSPVTPQPVQSKREFQDDMRLGNSLVLATPEALAARNKRQRE